VKMCNLDNDVHALLRYLDIENKKKKSKADVRRKFSDADGY
jgi:hypothetical protein